MSNIQILNNEFHDQMQRAIYLFGDSTGGRFLIDSNLIENVNGIGIEIQNINDGVVSKNVIKNIGLIKGYGISVDNNMSGIALRGSNNVVRFNTIDSCGYIGIRFDGMNNLVEKNIIKNTIINLSDSVGERMGREML